MIRSLCVCLSREDGKPDNTLTRVIRVVAGLDFQIRGARLHECEAVGTVKMEVAYKGKTDNEPGALREVMRVLGVSSLTEVSTPALV